MKDLFDKLLKATQPEQVREILVKIGKSNYRFEPVGSRKNNLATINIGSDPAAGIIERVTNAIDAVLEKEWLNKNEPVDIKSPRSASENWFGIEEGKLNNIEDALDKRIKNLSNKIQVTLYDSGKETKPTVEIRDKGIGLKPEQFSKTILDLNGNNKIGKLHLMGAYGQGGSTALSYNDLTIIMSRPYQGTDKEKSLVAWTIVRINPGDVNKDKHEWYEYLVDSKNGQPFSSLVPEDEFESGTLVRHIMMDINKYKGKITTPTNSLWYLAHNYLFDTIIPFTISDRRGDRNDNRSVMGNNRLLTYTDNLEYKQSVPLTFKDGKVIIYYWVLNGHGDNPKDRIKHYTLPSSPIIITFNGQKQGTLNNTLIKSDLKLPFLDRYLIVQIEADNMDNDSKRQLFSSTRESLRDTSILDELKKLTIDTLKEDTNLVRLDKERREKYFNQSDTQVLDSLRKRLARRINSFLKSTGSGQEVVATKTSETTNSDKLPEIPVEDPPTFFELTTQSPKEVFVNKSFSIKFKSDAHPNYFLNADTFVAFIEPQSFGLFTGTARVVDGYGIAYFKTSEEVQPDDIGQITLELRPPRQKTLSGTVDVLVVNEPEKGGSSGEGNNKAPNINVEFVSKDSEYYKENDWDEFSVAKVADSQEGIYIFVSSENRHLNKLVVRAQRHSQTAVDNIKNKYLEHISFYAFVFNSNNNEKIIIENGADVSDEIVEKLNHSQLNNASETVCGMISDFFESVITESIDEEDSVLN